MTTRLTGDSRSLKKFVRLDKEKRELETKLKKAKAELAEAEVNVLNHFEKMGMSKASVDGLTVYVKRQLWAGREEEVTHEQLTEALRAENLGAFCGPRVNSLALSAYFREEADRIKAELDEDVLFETDMALPAPLKGIVKLSEKISIATRKG